MTIQHGIDHLKKHDSPTNRIYAAMLTTILNQMGEDIPLPGSSAQETKPGYLTEMPKKIGLYALADSREPSIEAIDPEQEAAIAEREGIFTTELQEMLAGYYGMAQRKVMDVEQKGLFGNMKKTGSTEWAHDEELENGKTLTYFFEVPYRVNDSINEPLSLRMSVGYTDDKDDALFDMGIDFQDSVPTAVNVNSASPYELYQIMYRVRKQLDEAETSTPPDYFRALEMVVGKHDGTSTVRLEINSWPLKAVVRNKRSREDMKGSKLPKVQTDIYTYDPETDIFECDNWRRDEPIHKVSSDSMKLVLADLLEIIPKNMY